MNSRKVCAICGLKSALGCSKCKLKYYCSREHQEVHWPTHNEECMPINLEEDTDEKVYIAKRDIKEGQLIFTNRPFMVFPIVPMRNDRTRYNIKVCMGCCKEIPQNEMESSDGIIVYSPVPQCPVCKWPVCSDTCSHRPFHAKLECKILAQRNAELNTYLALDPEILYNRIYMLRALLMKDVFPEKWKMLLDLPTQKSSNLTSESKEMQLQAAITFIREECNQLQFDQILIREVYWILDANLKLDSSVKLENMSRFIAQGCLYNLVSFHCCAIDDTESSLLEKFERQYFALTAIQKGESLKLPIFGLREISGTRLRRQVLMESTGLACTCQLCADPTEFGSYLSAIRCLICKPSYGNHFSRECNPSSGYLLPSDPLSENSIWGCQKCFTEVNPSDTLTDSLDKVDQQVKICIETIKQVITDAATINNNAFLGRLTAKQLSLLENTMSVIPRKLLPNLAKFLEDQQELLHRNHYILLRGEQAYLDFLYFYLCLNRSERFVPSSLTLRDLYSFKLNSTHRFFTPSSDEWLKLNDELQRRTTDLLTVYQKVCPDASMSSGKLFYFLTFSKLMILKYEAMQHRDYEKFLEGLKEWGYFKRKADICFRRIPGVTQGYGGSDSFVVECLEEMDSVDPAKNNDMHAIFINVLS